MVNNYSLKISLPQPVFARSSVRLLLSDRLQKNAANILYFTNSITAYLVKIPYGL